MKASQDHSADAPLGLAGRIAQSFIDSKLTLLIVIASLLLGVFAVVMLPREEEPQIKVPMVDVLVSMPGFHAKEVEERATRPMEKLLWEIPGVEYIYSTSSEGQAMVIVRFKVGEDMDSSLVKLNQKLQSNFDKIPHGVSTPLIKARTIDDVPILALTFHSARYDHLTLRRLVAQVDDAVKQVPLVAETTIIGGAQRQLRVLLDPVRLASRGLSPAGLVPMLQQANKQFSAGNLTSDNHEIIVETGAFLRDAAEVGNVVVGVYAGKPVYLRDVADIVDGAEEPSQYVFFGSGVGAGILPAVEPGFQPGGNNSLPPFDVRVQSSAAEISRPNPGGKMPPSTAGRMPAATLLDEPAVTLSIAKRPGANAITVADDVLKKIDTLKGYLIPADVHVTVTRNYGLTAEDKSNELLWHMLLAVVSVSFLILLVLGWRESLIVLLAIPATLALTLLVFYLYGFTLNRITLFALIFSIGILVDDAIVVVENIVRHFHLPESKGRSRAIVAIEAVSEVGNPTILATFAVIAAVLPMAFVGGLMGPYMRPIPIGATAAMFFSLAISFIVTPWAAIRILQWRRKIHSPDDHAPDHEAASEIFFGRRYRRLMTPLIASAKRRYIFLAALVGLLLVSMALVGIGWVKVKMLPFDNKSEFQIILNMPEGSSLERTAQAAREIAAAVRTEPEVTDYEIYAGVASPFNFNGLVRHYFMRRGANVADLQINLVPKNERKAQSHDIAKRVRPRVAEIAAKFGARVAVAEVPPGPPVLQTLVAEIYGPTEKARLTLAQKVIDIFHSTPGVVDTDWYIEADQPKVELVIDKEKAALNGISAETISQTLKIAVGGGSVDLLHVPREKEDVNIVLQLPLASRSTPEELLALRIRSGADGTGPLVPLRELVKVKQTITDKSIYHKNLMPVTYVIGDVAGVVESPVYAILKMNQALQKLDAREFSGTGVPPVRFDPAGVPNSETHGRDARATLKIYNAAMPFTDQQPAIKWDGEWHITIEVFRDLGLAFAAVLVLIYVLMVGWFKSFLTPLIVMIVIPFSLIGVLPAHGILHAFFTATSMIGFMAGAGIVVRNSIILVDFIELRLAEGHPLAEAVVEAGMIRFRPIMLTALAVVAGATVILSDPIFQGLAIALMAGSLISMFTAPVLVPLLYFMANQPKAKKTSQPTET